MIRLPGRVGRGVGTAHAKAILVGEHAVVHGSAAIALPVLQLALTATVTHRPGPARIESALYTGTLESIPPSFASPATAVAAALERLGEPADGFVLQVEGEIPPARGLGSSAAAAAAIGRAFARASALRWEQDEEFALIQTAERVAHGNPSGLDARAVVAHGPILFESGQAEPLETAFSGVFLVADTGEPGGTRAAVGAVAALLEASPARTRGILDEIAATVPETARCLAQDDPAGLGAILTRVHTLLTRLTVSSPALDRLVRLARQAGALGAKLTGGGRGGCIVAVAADLPAARRIAAALEGDGAAVWILDPA